MPLSGSFTVVRVNKELSMEFLEIASKDLLLETFEEIGNALQHQNFIPWCHNLI